MNNTLENANEIEEDISNVVMELYEQTALFNNDDDETIVPDYLAIYIKRVSHIGLKIGKTNFYSSI